MKEEEGRSPEEGGGVSFWSVLAFACASGDLHNLLLCVSSFAIDRDSKHHHVRIQKAAEATFYNHFKSVNIDIRHQLDIRQKNNKIINDFIGLHLKSLI